MFGNLAQVFRNAAIALKDGLVEEISLTGTGVKKLDFNIEGRTFTALEQNPDRTSPGAIAARRGDKVYFIREIVMNEHGQPQSIPMGTIDLTTGDMNQFGPAVQPVDYAKIQKVVEMASAQTATK